VPDVAVEPLGDDRLGERGERRRTQPPRDVRVEQEAPVERFVGRTRRPRQQPFGGYRLGQRG
jgi:hypothetical protein